MTEDRKILIGFDSTPEGEDAVELGRALAEAIGARPLVAIVVPWPAHLLAADDLTRQLDRETKEHFEILRERLGPLDPEFRALADRAPSRVLHDLASEERTITVAVGATHRGPFGRTLPGSTALSLLHGAPCAVAVAPRGYAQRRTPRIERTGVAFDGSPESWSALETAIGLAERNSSTITVLAVAEPNRYGYDASLEVLAGAGLQSHEQAEKRRLLDLAVGHVPNGVTVHSRLLEGGPGLVLAQASAEFDLLICGSRGYGPVRRTIAGSTTRVLVDHAHCPLLVLARGMALDPLGLRNRELAKAG